MPSKLNSAPLLFSDLGAMLHDLLLGFLHCGARKSSFGHFGHIQGKVHVGLF